MVWVLVPCVWFYWLGFWLWFGLRVCDYLLVGGLFVDCGYFVVGAALWRGDLRSLGCWV